MLRRKSILDTSTKSVSFSQRTTVRFIECDTDYADTMSVTSSSSCSCSSDPSAPSSASIDKIMNLAIIDGELSHRSRKELLRLRLKDLTTQMQALRCSMVKQSDLMNDLRDVTRGVKRNEETDRALKSQLEELRKARTAQAHLQEALRLVSASEP